MHLTSIEMAEHKCDFNAGEKGHFEHELQHTCGSDPMII